MKFDDKKDLFIVIAFLLCMVIGFIFLYYYAYNKGQREERAITNQNTEALKGELKIIKTKNGELIYEKASLTSDIEVLKELNLNLYGKIKNLGLDVKTYTDLYLTYKLKCDTLSDSLHSLSKSFDINVEKYRDGIYKNLLSPENAKVIEWGLLIDDFDSKDTLIIDGCSVFNVALDTNSKDNKFLILNEHTDWTNLYQKINIDAGISYDKEKKIYYAYAHSKNKNISFNVDSYIDQTLFYKNKKSDDWSFGPTFGIGLHIPLKDDSKTSIPALFIGVGVTFNLFTF